MLTFILNVLGKVLGIRIYIAAISARSGPCARPRDFQHRFPFIPSNIVLVNFGRPLSPPLMEQTLTAILVNGHRHSFAIAPNRSLTYPRVSFDNGRPPQRPSLRCLKQMTGVTQKMMSAVICAYLYIVKLSMHSCLSNALQNLHPRTAL